MYHLGGITEGDEGGHRSHLVRRLVTKQVIFLSVSEWIQEDMMTIGQLEFPDIGSEESSLSQHAPHVCIFFDSHHPMGYI